MLLNIYAKHKNYDILLYNTNDTKLKKYYTRIYSVKNPYTKDFSHYAPKKRAQK